MRTSVFAATLRLAITAAGISFAVSLPVVAKECPLHPVGISRAALDGRNVLISVAGEQSLSPAGVSAELALAAARLEAKVGLAKEVSSDGKTLSGVTELFNCITLGIAYSGVMVREPTSSPISGSSRLALPDQEPRIDPPATGVALHPVPASVRRAADGTTRNSVKYPSAGDQVTISIGQSIRENPTPTADTIDYEIILP